MIDLSISVGDQLNKFRNSLEKDRKAMSRAFHYAMFDTGDAIIEANKKEMSSVFDRPTSWTLNALFKKVNNGTLTVATKDGKFHRADNYLDVQQRGVPRGQKALESVLRGSGVLPGGWFIVPGSGAQMDGHGNWSAAQIKQVIRWFKSAGQRSGSAKVKDEIKTDVNGKNKKRKVKKVQASGSPRFLVVHVIRTKHTQHLKQPGIYRASRTARERPLDCVAIFVQKATYRQAYPFEKVSINTFDKVFESNFKRALAKLGAG